MLNASTRTHLTATIAATADTWWKNSAIHRFGLILLLGSKFQNYTPKEICQSMQPPQSHVGGFGVFQDFPKSKEVFKNLRWKNRPLHPGRLTWNIQITHLERKMIFQTPMIMFHVNLPGCTFVKTRGVFWYQVCRTWGPSPREFGAPSPFSVPIFNFQLCRLLSAEFWVHKADGKLWPKKKNRDEKSWDFTEF